MGISVDNMELFREKHPDLASYVVELLGTYKICQRGAAVSTPVGVDLLDIAYRHVYETDPGGCPWCQKRLAILKEGREKILNRASNQVSSKVRVSNCF